MDYISNRQIKVWHGPLNNETIYSKLSSDSTVHTQYVEVLNVKDQQERVRRKSTLIYVNPKLTNNARRTVNLTMVVLIKSSKHAVHGLSNLYLQHILQGEKCRNEQ